MAHPDEHIGHERRTVSIFLPGNEAIKRIRCLRDEHINGLTKIKIKGVGSGEDPNVYK